MSRLRTEGLAIRRNHFAQLADALEARSGAVPRLPHNSLNATVRDTNVDDHDNVYENVDVLQDIPYINVNVRADRPLGNIAHNARSTPSHTALDEQERRQQTLTTPEEAEAGELGRATSETSLEQDKFQIPRKEWNKKLIKLIRAIAIITLFFAVLTSATLSKVTFVAIAAKMYNAVANGERNHAQFSITFTQIVIVLMIPQLITFVRMFIGVIGKKRSIYPLPSIGALIVVSKRAEVYTSMYLCMYVPEYEDLHSNHVL